MRRRRVVIRCKDCWRDIYIALEGDALKRCDFCRGMRVYEHAYCPTKKKKEKEE